VERVRCPLEADALVLDHLARLGCDPAEPRECRHYLYIPAELDAHAVASSLSRDGWDAETEAVGGSWLITAMTRTPLNAAVVRDTRTHFEALAGAYGGEYDGWEAAAD
jgi:hypothetical protein